MATICPHFHHKESINTTPSSCAECPEEKELWLCISCDKIHCGRYMRANTRYAKAHAVKHFERTGHALVKFIGEDLYYCYLCSKDMRRSNGLKKSRRKLEKYSHITGVYNLGNTCFVNVIIQMLYHSILFRDALIHGKKHYSTPETSRRMTRRQTAIAHDASLFKDLCDLVESMWSSTELAVDPEKFIIEMWKIGPNFQEFQQQDAQEFLRFLLDRIQHESYYKHRQVSLSSMFHGILTSRVTCEKCGKISTKNDSFYDLSLSIPSKYLDVKNKVMELSHPCTLIECMQNFCSVERLVDNDQYKCSDCENYENCTKKLTIKQAPLILSFQIKRFRWSRSLRTKIETFIEFPILNFDVSQFTDTPQKKLVYDLYAVIVHHGSAGSGHYIIYCWNHEHNSWFEINDHEAIPISADVVMEQSAYMLFYLQRSVNSNLLNAISESESGDTTEEEIIIDDIREVKKPRRIN